MRHAVLSVILILLGALPLRADEARPTILILDASGSMWGQIAGVPKIDIAREVTTDFLTTLPATQPIGLMAYGHRKKGDCSDIELLAQPATGNRDALIAAIRRLSPKGRTPLSQAVIRAAETLKYQDKAATVILISDGKETCGYDPCEVGQTLSELGVNFTAHVIGFNVAKAEDKSQLQCLAKNTGGQFLTADNATDLTKALANVAAAKPRQMRLIALDGEGGPEITEDLIWQVTDLETGTALVTNEVAATLSIALGTSRYRIGVVRPEDGASSAREVVLAELAGTRIALILPPTLPEADILSAPDQAMAGALLEIAWTGPDGNHDQIVTAQPDARPGKFASSAYTSTGAPLALRMPSTPGTYEIRYHFSEKNAVLARRMIEVLPVTASLEAAERATAGSTISVDWLGPNYERDFVTVTKPGDRDSALGHLAYTKAGTPARIAMPALPGTYEIRYVMSQGSTVLARRPITVTVAEATLSLPTTALVGASVPVHWSGPANRKDYIAIAELKTPSRKHLSYDYARKGNPVELTMPLVPGRYEVRYILGTGRKIIATRDITLEPVEITLATPDTAKVGAEVTIGWSGPGYARDYISIATPDSRDSAYLNYSYARKDQPLTLQMPGAEGTYEIRYVANGSPDRVLERRVIRLESVTASVTGPARGQTGETIRVSWTGPAYKGDYIAVGLKGAKRYAAYRYLNDTDNVEIRLPDQSGAYELWYVMQADDTVIARQDILVE